MPFIKTTMLIENVEPVELADDGQTIGMLVDAALADMLNDMPPNSVPQSVEFSFDGPDDWHRFTQSNNAGLANMMTQRRRLRKSKRPYPNDVAVSSD